VQRMLLLRVMTFGALLACAPGARGEPIGSEVQRALGVTGRSAEIGDLIERYIVARSSAKHWLSGSSQKPTTGCRMTFFPFVP
jgi:hypothetical protein